MATMCHNFICINVSLIKSETQRWERVSFVTEEQVKMGICCEDPGVWSISVQAHNKLMNCLNSSQPLVQPPSSGHLDYACKSGHSTAFVFWLKLEINTVNTQFRKCSSDALKRLHAAFIEQRRSNTSARGVARIRCGDVWDQLVLTPDAGSSGRRLPAHRDSFEMIDSDPFGDSHRCRASQ